MRTTTDVRQCLPASEAQLRAVLDTLAPLVGVTTPDGTVIEANAASLEAAALTAEQVLGRPLVDTYWWSHSQATRARLSAAIARARLGEPSRYDAQARVAGGRLIEVDVMVRPLFDDLGQVSGLVHSAIDITERKRAEANAAFLASVSLDLVRLQGIDEILRVVAPKLGDHLGLSRCVFGEIDEAAETATVIHDWHCDGVPGVSGTYRLAEYLDNDEFQRAGRAGALFVVNDTHADPRTDAERYAALKIGAFVCVPLVQDGAWRYLLAVYHSTAHVWRDDEIELTRELATRLWTQTQRLRAEASLRESKATLELTLESAQVGDWDLDLATDTSRRSLRHDRCFGYETPIPEAQWGFQRFMEHVHPDDRAKVQSTFHGAVASGELWRCEFRVVWPDRSVHWLEAHGSIDRSAAGNPTRVRGIVADVSARKRAQALHAAQSQSMELMVRDAPLVEVLEALVHTVEEHSRAGVLGSVLLLDDDGQHVRHGAGPSLPAAYMQAIDGAPIGPAAGSCGTAAYTKRPVYVSDIATDPLWADYKHLALAHGLRACWSTPILSGTGRVLGTFAMYYREPRAPSPGDLEVLHTILPTAALVIQRKRDQERLRDSEARFRAVADNVPHLAWMADGNGAVEWFNRRWLEYTGTTLEASLGAGWKAVHHPDHVDAVVEKFERHLRDGKDWEDTFPLRRHDGEYRWFLSRMKVIRDEEGRVLRFFGTNTDVTEQREMAEHLRQLTAELSEADRRKDEFLATLSHELRNPLAPVSNALALIRRAGGNEAIVEKCLATMERQVALMVRLIDDLLDVSRITRNKLELRLGEAELGAILHDAMETCRPLAQRQRHAVTLTLPDIPVRLHADRSRLVQVFGNLLNNACKFTPAGGRVELVAAVEDGEAVVTVKDTGVGIPAHMLEAVFTLFTQVNRSLESCESGLGIGLSLVQRLVQMHGGTVVALSGGLGCGSEFVVRLPLTASPAPVPQPQARAELPAPPPGRRVLVVDDNRDSADTLASLLALYGSLTEIAHDGLGALEKAASFVPDVILLDIGLPKMNGYEVCRALRQQEGGGRLVIVAMTGWGKAEDRRRSHEAGFDGHMVKPVEHDSLIALLSALPAAPDPR